MQTVFSSEIVMLPGQRHVAMDTAPDLFVRAVTEFVLDGKQTCLLTT